MPAESTRIGLGSCPVCASPKAHYTLSKKGLVCVTCNSCNFQGFARSERSDEMLRGHIKPATPEAVLEPTPSAVPVVAPMDAADEADQKPVPSVPTPSTPSKPAPAAGASTRRSFMSW